MKTFLRYIKAHPSVLIYMLVAFIAAGEILPHYALVLGIVALVGSLAAIIQGVIEALRDGAKVQEQITSVYNETPRGKQQGALHQLLDEMHFSRERNVIPPKET